MASTNIETGSAGVITAATISIATKAYLRHFRRSALSITPSRESAMTAVGNSNTTPLSRTIDVNIDIYDPRLIVFTTSAETV